MKPADFIKARAEDMTGWRPEWGLEPLPPPGPEEKRLLPAIVPGSTFLETEPVIPSPVVHGLLDRGCKMTVGGSSKSRKSWFQIGLGLSVASGTKWLGFEVERGRVLFCNFEIQAGFFHRRVAAVARAMQLSELSNFDAWNLRGRVLPMELLMREMTASIKATGREYSVVVLDPLYKLLGGADENRASDIAAFLNHVEGLAEETGAAVVMGTHFSKGQQAEKAAMDRISGSGVFARDPDCVLTLTAHEEPDAYAVETVIRDHPPQEPFCVRWQYPAFQRDEALDPERLKGPSKGRKEAPELTDEAVRAHVPVEGSIRKQTLVGRLNGAGYPIKKAEWKIRDMLEEGTLFEWSVREGKTRPSVHVSRKAQEEPNLESKAA